MAPPETDASRLSEAEQPGKDERTVLLRLIHLSTVFFGAMMMMEVSVEATTRHLKSLGAYQVGLLITVAQFFGCAVVAWISGGRLKDPKESAEQRTMSRAMLEVWLPYFLLTGLIFCGTGLPNIAAGWVQYPVKVVFKSSKLIPTMMASAAMRNSRQFETHEYVAAVMICGGTAAFSYHAGQTDTVPGLAALGVSFLTASILADSIVSNAQQKLMQRDGVPPMTMMLRLNVIGFFFTTAALLVEGKQMFVFTLDTPRMMQLIGYMVCVGTTLGVGAWANTSLVHEAGSVFTTGVGTIRKVFTVILSYIVFPKPMTTLHIGGGVLVFAGLSLSQFSSLSLFKGTKLPSMQPLLYPKPREAAV